MYSYVLLIVEDDPLCARTLSRLCRQSLGVTVICVAVEDADEAAAQMLSSSTDSADYLEK